MNSIKESVMAAIIVVAVVMGACYYSYVSGQEVMKQNIISYCKADGAYLTEGLMLQCSALTSKKGTGV